MSHLWRRLRLPLAAAWRNRNSAPLIQNDAVIFGAEEDGRSDDKTPTTTTPTSIQAESGFVSEGTPSTSSSSSPASSSSPSSSSSAVGTPWYFAVFLVVNAALGSALLNFPRAFDAAGGVAAALSVQTVLLGVAVASLLILAICADAHGAATYQDVVKGSLGSIGHFICSACVVVYCFGTCVTFLIVIGDQWDRYFYSFDPLYCHLWWKRRTFTIAASSFCFILPLCFSRRIDFLKYVSAFGVATIFYINALQVYKFYDGVPASAKGPVKTSPDHWTDIFLVMPTIFFGYQCHVSAVPIYSCLRRRNVGEFLKTVLAAMLICCVTYSVAAVYGYLTFGGKVVDDILSNYDAKDPLVSTALIAMALKTYTSYPLLIYCGRTGVDSLWIKFRSLTPAQAHKGEMVRRILTVLTWFCGSVLTAIYIPGIDSVIPLLGACASAFIVIFPGLCLLMVALKEDDDDDNNNNNNNNDDDEEFDKSKKMALTPTPPTSESESASTADVDATSVGARLPTGNRRGRWRRCWLLSAALTLVVFGAFILGIIVANSFAEGETKIALCNPP